jgi:AAHS family 4-hydroxybenzoate transporter-like MFS transporter
LTSRLGPIIITNNVRYSNKMMRDEMLEPAPSDARDDGKLNRFQVVTILLCSLVLFVDGYDTQVISYAAPILVKQWQLSHAVLGQIFSAGFGGGMVGYILLAPMSDLLGHRKATNVSVLAFSLFTLLTVVATSPGELIAIRFFTGMALGVAAPSVVALAGEYSPRRMRATVILVVYCGFSLGFVAAGAISALLLRNYGWQGLFWVGAIAPLALFPFLYWALPESLDLLVRKQRQPEAFAILRRLGIQTNELPKAENSPVHDKVPVVALLRDGRARGTIIVCLIFFFNAGSFYLLQSWLPTLLSAAGRPLETVASATSITTVGGITSVLLIGPLMDRLGHDRALAAVYLFGAFSLCFLGLTLSAPTLLLLTAAFLSGACVSGGQKSIIALTTLYYPASLRGSAVGFALGVGRLGAMIGPLIAGSLLSAGLQPLWLFVSLAALLLICALLTLLLRAGQSLLPATDAVRSTP